MDKNNLVRKPVSSLTCKVGGFTLEQSSDPNKKNRVIQTPWKIDDYNKLQYPVRKNCSGLGMMWQVRNFHCTSATVVENRSRHGGKEA